MKKQTHLHFGWPEDEDIFSKSSFLGESLSFLTALSRYELFSTQRQAAYTDSVQTDSSWSEKGSEVKHTEKAPHYVRSDFLWERRVL